jgi:excinuclease ABC subunit C
MEEVIDRRFARYFDEYSSQSTAKFLKLPDIIFVDGGGGQIRSADKVLLANSIKIPVCGMVKDDKHRTRGLIFMEHEVNLPHTSEGFKLVARIQDEVHRFAVEYHRKLRSEAQIHSILDDIDGIGPTRRKELLKHFKAIENIRLASIEELEQAESMNKKSAEAVYNFFRRP